MGPSKRKTIVRRQVLDLNSKEDSPQRSAWQTKYQSVLPEEEVCLNGYSESSSKISNNPLSGLLGNYNSDSDSEEPSQKVTESLDAKVEDFLKEIQSISAETNTQDEIEIGTEGQSKMPDKTLYLPSITNWQQCYDHNSGYPYYWNTETNEVTWEMPGELKATIAIHQQQQQTQLQQQIQVESVVKKNVCKYSWQTDSNLENEKNDLTKSQKVERELIDIEKSKTCGPVLQASQQNIKFKGKDIKLAPEDLEAVNEFTCETSSLLAHGVQDTGPPGDESFQTVKQTKISAVKKEALKCNSPAVENSLPQVETAVPSKIDVFNCAEDQSNNKPEIDKVADDAIAEIKNETASEHVDEISEAQTDNSAKMTGIALIANYGDDSEPEDNSIVEKHETSSKCVKQVFPVEIPQEKKPLFPCLGAEVPKMEVKSKELLLEESEPVSNMYNLEFEDPAVQKAFKRKRRIEFSPVAYCPSTSKSSDKSPDHPVTTPTTQYNMDPEGNEHHGFGFNGHKAPAESERKTYKNCGGIQFIKAETINVKEPKEKETELDDKNMQKSTAEGSVKQEEIEYAATLLREKVNFLTAGTGSISAIQQMAIELETLVVAWKDGALTPPYLLRWLNEKCSEIIHHEKSAAPAGWICFWDRKSKRYSYRNVTTKEIQWEYPTAEEKTKGKDGEVDGAGDEMDICDTPPHLSPGASEKQTDETLSTPPPPVITAASEMVSPPTFTPQPPSPPQISFCEEEVSKTKKKLKSEEICKSIEDEAVSASASTDSTNKQSEDQVPPLPPMPPPPPPPPEESPPPLPDSPPPPVLPVEPDQPLPPGVDEPECSFFRTPKHAYKKTQPETAAFSTELMMTYGYGLPVQQVVSSNGQPIAMRMQPLEYHTYMQDAVSNSYVVQSSLTSHVIHCPAKKPKPSLTSELLSFYTDLAKMDNSGESIGPSIQTKPTASAVPHEPPSSPPAPVVSVTTAPKSTSLKSSSVSSSAGFKALENVSSNGVGIKRKKKNKTASGLSLKKKGVSSLVAKWQQVQQEVRRDFSDDDDDDDDATSK